MSQILNCGRSTIRRFSEKLGEQVDDYDYGITESESQNNSYMVPASVLPYRYHIFVPPRLLSAFWARHCWWRTDVRRIIQYVLWYVTYTILGVPTPAQQAYKSLQR
jgi:hypothetical protein